jgi:hypothetical protein
MADQSHQLPRRSQRLIAETMVNNTHPVCILVIYGVASEDPPTHNAIDALLANGFRVSVVQLIPDHITTSTLSASVSIHEISGPKKLRRIRAIYNLLRWRRFKVEVRKQIKRLKPEVVVTIMLHALATVPKRSRWNYRSLVSCIYDIPCIDDAGRLDRRILQRGWRRLRRADIVWASDVYKAQLAQRIARLRQTPLICHNCPSVSYLSNPLWPRDEWLRTQLRRAGANIENAGGSILLRAGAIGEHGGIEATLEGMKGLPEDYIFLMIGRPPAEYKQKIRSYISTLDLGNRAFLWDRPSDGVWKSALQGADIGHLIHGPFPPGRMTRLYDLNSSLSNNRLFQYMAASLPIIAYDDSRMDNIYKEVSCFHVARLSNLVTDIQRAWCELGGNEARRKLLGEAGRKAHLRKYCWEVQFAPVFDAIKA